MPPGFANPSKRAATFTPSPKISTSIDDDVTDVDADAEFDSLLLRHINVSLCHAALYFDGTARRIHDACELDQHSIARGLDDAAVMLFDLLVDELTSMCLQLRECALLIGAHQPAVACNVGCENSCQPPLYALFGHIVALPSGISKGA